MTTLVLTSPAEVSASVGSIVTVTVTVSDDTIPVFRSSDGYKLSAKKNTTTGAWSAQWVTLKVGTYAITVNAGDATPVSASIVVGGGGPGPDPDPEVTLSDEAVAVLMTLTGSATRGATRALVAADVADSSTAVGAALSATFVPGSFVEDTSGQANSLRIGAGALPDADGGLNNLAIGVDAGKDIDATGPHLFIGNQAGQHVKGTDSGVSSHNIGIGLQAMRGGGTLGSDGTKVTGGFNVCLGIQTLWVLTEGDRNVAMGFSALRYNKVGDDNTAIGTNALTSTVQGASTAVGSQALAQATSALANTAVGYQALTAVDTGGFNAALGFLAGSQLDGAATRNVILGCQALPDQTGGEDNVAVGYLAGAGPAAGNGNTWIGKNARPNSSTEVALVTALGWESRASALRAVALGAQASAAHASSVALGAESVTTSANQVMCGPRDVEITSSSLGLILKSPDGSRYRVKVANGGALTAALA